MADKCPICDSDLSRKEKIGSDWDYTCPRCGDYQTTNDFEDDLPVLLNEDILSSIPKKDIQKVAILSHWIRMKNESIPSFGHPKRILIYKKLVEDIIKQSLPTPAEQADKFVFWLGDNIEYADHYIELNKISIQAIIGAINESEFYFVFNHLKNKGIIKTETASGRGKTVAADATLSFEGWEYYQELKRGIADSRKAFMAMQYDEEQLDKIVEGFFKPAVEKTGFDLFKLVDRPKAGLIDDRLRLEIQTSRFLIADLTHQNRGAYWEAGYAEGLGKPVIYTCEKKKFKRLKTHFDTNHHLTILWDGEKPEVAAEELKLTIRATLPGEAKLTDE